MTNLSNLFISQSCINISMGTSSIKVICLYSKPNSEFFSNLACRPLTLLLVKEGDWLQQIYDCNNRWKVLLFTTIQYILWFSNPPVSMMQMSATIYNLTKEIKINFVRLTWPFFDWKLHPQYFLLQFYSQM